MRDLARVPLKQGCISEGRRKYPDNTGSQFRVASAKRRRLLVVEGKVRAAPRLVMTSDLSGHRYSLRPKEVEGVLSGHCYSNILRKEKKALR